MDLRQHPPFEQLQADLVYLMNRYSSEQCCCIAEAVAHQMERLLMHPLMDLFPELRKEYAKGLNGWRALAMDPAAMPGPTGQSIH